LKGGRACCRRAVQQSIDIAAHGALSNKLLHAVAAGELLFISRVVHGLLLAKITGR